MAAIQFPNNPNTGDLFTASNGIRYTYDGEKWKTLGSSTAGSEGQFLETPNILTLDKIIPGDTNTGAVGPMAIDAGITLTIPVSSTFRTLSGKSGSVLPSAVDSGGVKLAGDATAQTITGTGGLKTDGLLDSGGGLNVTGGNVGIGTSSPSTKLEVNSGGILVTPVPYSAYEDQSYLIAGTTGWTGATTNWNTYGIQHRIKTNSVGVPRVTIDTASGEAYCVTNNNNVGIGDTSPSQKLSVRDDGSQLRLSKTGANTEQYLDLYANGSYAYLTAKNNTNRAGIILRGRSDTEIQEYMRIKANGNVGIGTDNPTHLLHVGSTTNALGTTAGNQLLNFRIQSGTSNTDFLDFTTKRVSTGSTWPTAAQRIQRKVDNTLVGYIQLGHINSDLITFGVNNTEYARIDGTGNVGIGTSSPSAKLDVNGQAHINKPSDFWSSGRSFYDINGEGNLTSQGSFGTHLTSNGYRGANTLWVSSNINGQTGAAQIHLNPAGYIAFNTEANKATGDSAAVSTKMTINGSGNVGIGTTSPDAPLEVVGSSGGELELARFRIEGQTNNPMLQVFADESQKLLTLGTSGSVSGSQMAFDTSGGEAMRITSAGNVGIGTSSPQAKLHVQGSYTAAKIWLQSTNNGLSSFNPENASIDLTANGMNTTSKYTPSINFGSTDPEFTTTNPKFGAAINAEATQAYSTDTTGGMNLNFWTSPSNPGTGHGLVQRMIISQSGNVGIGTTSPSAKLEVNGDEIRLHNVAVGSAELSIYNGAAVAEWFVGQESANYHAFQIRKRVGASYYPYFAVATDGNVGIGTSSPSVKLDVNGTISGTLQNSDVLTATASSSAGAVGTYAFLKGETNSSAGSTKSGSNLRYSNANGTTSGTPSGNWRLMGYTQTSSNRTKTSLWLRYV